MSFLNQIVDKVVGSVLSNSKPLSLFTSTTLSQSGTSLANVVKDVTSASTTAANNTLGPSGDLLAPITSMRDYAISVDPTNTSKYASSYSIATQAVSDSFSASTPGFSNSLYSIQTGAKDAVTSGMTSMGSSISTINLPVYNPAISLGMSGLGPNNSLIDSSSVNAFSAGTSCVNDKVSSINSSLASTVKAENLASKLPDTSTLKVLPGADTLPEITASSTSIGSNSTTSSGISEGGAPSAAMNSTDLVYQDIKVYVEGVQVPFESCSISQSIGMFPSAVIQLPPQAGLMDIARYYQPKVHIFYTDNNLGGDRLLFWGHIVSCNYSRSQQSASATISFECIHKNALLQQITLEWSGGGVGAIMAGNNITNPQLNAPVVQVNSFNSEFSWAMALKGITGNQTAPVDELVPTNKDISNADVTLLGARFKKIEKRMLGMPSVMMNQWNQLKKQVYTNEKLNTIFSKMYVPLLEEGVRFFDRLSGHPFLEDQVHASRVKDCNDQNAPGLNEHDSLLAPAFHMDIQSAIQTQVTLSITKSALGFSGEFTSFYDMFTNFYMSMEYELLTLASPSELPIDPDVIVDPDNLKSWLKVDKMAIETIVKPQVPFYYSPICNVILPNMFHTVNVSQQESEIPTRITAMETSIGQVADNPGAIGMSYRAPHSIREGIALGIQALNASSGTMNGSADGSGVGDKPVPLRETTGGSFNLPGKYEIGRGVKHRKLIMPSWLTYLAKDQNNQRASNSDQNLPVQGSKEYKDLLNLHLAWIERFGYSSATDPKTKEIVEVRNRNLDYLDPYSDKSQIMAFERLLFSAADYEFTKEVVKSRNGNVECIFNPYIVPGYPMDVIDASPNHPSWHGMCGSVTHSISSNGIGTSVGFLAASTYTELSNYELQPAHPWLRNALRLINVARGENLTDGGSTAQDIGFIGTTKNMSGSPDEFDPNATQAEAVDSRYSTDYGLSADPEYDSNAGDVTSVQQSLIGNPRAKEVADTFYRQVFCVGAVDPSQIFDFDMGGAKPVARSKGIWKEGHTDKTPTPNGGEGNDNLTGVGNLRLVCRPIEGKKSIEKKFNLKFIDMVPQNYNSTRITYQNQVATTRKLLEPGASMFLDYGSSTDIVRGIITP